MLQVPAKETTYYCAEFYLPQDGEFHMIATNVYNSNPDILYHVTITACPMAYYERWGMPLHQSKLHTTMD